MGEIIIYGRVNAHVEADHKPQEPIVLKPLNRAPKRLQRMLLALQKYSLQVKYKKGEMFLADTLSRAYLPEVNACEFSQKLESMDHTMSLALSDAHLVEIKHVSSDDPALQVLRKTIRRSWTESKSDVPEAIHA